MVRIVMRTIRWTLLAMLAVPTLAAANDVSVRAAVEKQNVYVGESFVFQIRVDGDDSPGKPDVSALTDFSVEELGGQTNNSSRITVINGQMTRNVTRAYVFNYRLTPKRAGRLTISPLTIKAGGKTMRTQAIAITAEQPKETDDFKLRMTLEKTTVFAGEPVVLTITWYVGKDVRSFELNLPLLQMDAFTFADIDDWLDPQKKHFTMRVGDGEIVAEKGQGTLDGKGYTTLTLKKVIIPQRPGTFALPKATIACDAMAGYRQERDFFGSANRAYYRKLITPSNSPTLTVKGLPAEGRPANFSGLVGRYKLEASADPTTVNVGDPITLTVRLTGPKYLDNVELPALAQQASLARDFKIPKDRAPGVVENGAKTFTQTLRAKSDTVKAIAPIELACFDPESKTYTTVSSEAIPLTVKATKVITASDAEGADATVVRTELKAFHEGIAYNYDDVAVVTHQSANLASMVTSPVWTLATLGPPAIFFALLVGRTVVRRRHADPARRKAKLAYGVFIETLKHTDSDAYRQVLDAFREYFGSKLRLTSHALTFGDIERPLGDRGVSVETLAALKALLHECEASYYSGTSDAGPSDLVDRAMTLAKTIDRSLQ